MKPIRGRLADMTAATTLQEGCQSKRDTGRPGRKLPPLMPLHKVRMSLLKRAHWVHQQREASGVGVGR